MARGLDYLRELNTVSVILRLTLAMFCGGMIGMERARKHRPAGFRTYMLVCMGAALTILLSQYEHYMLTHNWAMLADRVGIRTDVSRFGAQVINGIGFLGAGTIIVTGRQQVKGLTTAAGLWASACMGLAVGAGFYECVGLAFILIFLVVHLLPQAELYIIENSKDMIVFVEFESLDNVSAIINCIKTHNVQICDVELDHGKRSVSHHPSAVFSLRMKQKGIRARILATISGLDGVLIVHDI